MGEARIFQGICSEFVSQVNPPLPQGGNISHLPHFAGTDARSKNELEGVGLLPLQHLVLLVRHLGMENHAAILSYGPYHGFEDSDQFL